MGQMRILNASLMLDVSPITRDSQGATILFSIVASSRIGDKDAAEQLRYFIEKGFNPSATDNLGNTLWHAVAKVGASDP